MDCPSEKEWENDDERRRVLHDVLNYLESKPRVGLKDTLCLRLSSFFMKENVQPRRIVVAFLKMSLSRQTLANFDEENDDHEELTLRGISRVLVRRERIADIRRRLGLPEHSGRPRGVTQRGLSSGRYIR